LDERKKMQIYPPRGRGVPQPCRRTSFNWSMVELKVTFVISPNECKTGSAAERLHVGAGVGLGAGLGIGVGLGLGCGARYLSYVFKCIMLCTGTVSILSVSIHGFLGKPVSEKTGVRPEKRTNLGS